MANGRIKNGASYAGNIDDGSYDGEKVVEIQGDLSRLTISQRDYNEALDYDNRKKDGGRANHPSLGYAYSEMVDAEQTEGNDVPKVGAPSLFSPYSIFYHPKCSSTNDFFDVEGEDGAYPKFDKPTGYDAEGNPTSGDGGRKVSELGLINDAPPKFYKKNGQGKLETTTPYYVSDFVYAKYFKKIPLNHLVTLRRFPFPTYDNLEFEGNRVFKPIAQAVTYFGEPTGNSLADLTRFSGYINWEELQADVHDVEGEERGTNDSPFFDSMSPKAQSGLKYGNAFINQGSGQTSLGAQAQQEAYRFATDPNYTNEVLGPINVVERTNIRKRGIGATQSLNLVFEYKLRSISGINPRIAMLDLLCNMLALCFNNAKFWGGANRYFPHIQQFSFLGDQEAFYRGDYGTYISSFVDQMADGLGRGLDALSGVIGGILSGDMSALKNVASSAAGFAMDLQGAKSRPKVIGFKALLTGLPVGEWHLVIGNPYRPIGMIGNLIVKSFEFELDGPLSADDFPTNLKFSIQLEHGRPRDKGDLESVFNLGQGRMYYPPQGMFDVANGSAATGTVIKPNNNSNTDNKAKRNDYDTSFASLKDKEGRSGGYRHHEVDAQFAKKMKGTLF